jgi:ribonuclease T2
MLHSLPSTWLRTSLRLSVVTLTTLLCTACPTPAKTGQGQAAPTTPAANTGGGTTTPTAPPTNTQAPPPPAGSVQAGSVQEPGEGGDGDEGGGGGSRHHVAGQFDYYVLSLSWSPQFCASRGKQARPDDTQCGVGASFGFVLHGLWPQYAAQGYPESCAVPGPLDTGLVQRLQRIMPSQRLVQHEWQKHGTCSGLTAERYFSQAETLFNGLRIPPRLQKPSAPLTTSPAELRQELVASNPGLPPSSIAIYCRGALLREVRICYSKDLKPQSCAATVRDGCPSAGVTVLPPRPAATAAPVTQ